MADSPQAVVIDCGTAVTKFGFAGLDTPSTVSSSSSTSPADKGLKTTAPEEKKGEGVSSAALGDGSPIQRGVITDWDRMEKLWTYCFLSEMKVLPEQHAVLLTESMLSSKADREQITRVMFEKFRVESLCLNVTPVLSLFGCGRASGCAVEIGDGLTQIVPVYNGYALPHAVNIMRKGGRDVSKHLRKVRQQAEGLEMVCLTFALPCCFSLCVALLSLCQLLGPKTLKTPLRPSTVQVIKEQSTFVLESFDEERIAAVQKKDQPFELPDGRIIQLGQERFKAPEVLFKQDNFDKDRLTGLHQLLPDTIMKCDADIRPSLSENIVLSGGTSLIPGIGRRLLAEGRQVLPDDVCSKVRIEAPPGRENMAWVGASIIGSLSTFPLMSISRSDYEESGVSVVHKKCFNG